MPVEEVEVLPSYVQFRPNVSDEVPQTLRLSAQVIQFPMSEEDRNAMEMLSKKFDKEGNCAGLAAPQIGISKRIIVFATPDSPELRIWRPDFSDSMSKTIWINPSYEGIESSGFHEDYEGCFSVEGVAGLVKRYSEIHYTANGPDGEELQGNIRGYLARLVQHEIDHLNGVLFSDIATNLIPMEEYRQMRLDAVARGYR
jgi:peptide deformylase